MIGQNTKTTQSDELQDVAALLKDLPQVSAPANFNAGLQARIAAAKAEANEFADVVSLVKELPRVTAPADFDFRLRARIAQAKSEQKNVSAGWWGELFGRTFSWAQAGAAMAAVAIVVSVVTFGVLRSGKQSESTNPVVAVGIPTPQATSLSKSLPNSENKAEGSTLMAKNSAAETGRVKPNKVATPAKLTGSSASLPGRTERIEPQQPDDSGMIATRTVIIKHRSGEARVVNLSEYNLGLQTANLRATPNSSNKETVAANIF